MAKEIFHRLRRLPQAKLQIYQQQCAANLAIENLILNCQQLQAFSIIPRGFLTLYANMAEEQPMRGGLTRLASLLAELAETNVAKRKGDNGLDTGAKLAIDSDAEDGAS